MKSTIIYEKKKVTIEEFMLYHNTNLCWFIILLINLITNYYINIVVSNTIMLNECGNDFDCKKQLELLSDKLCFSKKLIYIGLLINLFLMFMYNKFIFNLEIIYRNILNNSNNSNNLNNSNKSKITIGMCLFIFSSIIYKPITIYLIYYQNEYHFDEKQLHDIITIAVLYYFLIEIISLGLIFFLIIFSFMVFFDYMCDIIHKFYKSNIKDITFEYTELKFVDIEKNA